MKAESPTLSRPPRGALGKQALRLAGQAVAYGAFMAVIGYLAAAPSYSPFSPGDAQIKVSFRHSGVPKAECRRLTPEEISRMPPNMRRALDCQRERLPLYVEIVLDDKLLHAAAIPPTGIWKDGPSKIYERFAVPAGRHTLVARLRDSRRSEGYDHERVATIELAPQQNFVIEFRADKGGFLFD